MKKLLGILIATLTMTTSQASMNQNGNEHFGKNTVIATQPRTATPNAQAHVKNKKVIKLRTHRVMPHGMDDNDEFFQIEDIATGYRRRDLNKIEHEDDISERVRWRLFLARQLALLKHKEVWQQNI